MDESQPFVGSAKHHHGRLSHRSPGARSITMDESQPFVGSAKHHHGRLSNRSSGARSITIDDFQTVRREPEASPLTTFTPCVGSPKHHLTPSKPCVGSPKHHLTPSKPYVGSPRASPLTTCSPGVGSPRASPTSSTLKKPRLVQQPHGAVMGNGAGIEPWPSAHFWIGLQRCETTRSCTASSGTRWHYVHILVT